MPVLPIPHGAIPVLIVAFHNAVDVNACLHALGRLDREPRFAVLVCENGGSAAFDRLLRVLTGGDGACDPAVAATLPPGSRAAWPRLTRIARLWLRTVPGEDAGRESGEEVAGRLVEVLVGEAAGNLGYAGGVNAWLDGLPTPRAWPGIWVLNPDTEPLPGALAALVAHAEANGVGMVGSRLIARDRPDIVVSRGLAWRRWRAATRVVGHASPATLRVTPEERYAPADAPSGASTYVTRDCLARTGPMDERYFLYFEDLDWGLRARRHGGGGGYAHDAVVPHHFGTTIGSALSRREQSPLAVYLDFRNRILFVRLHFTGWLPWTTLMEALEIAEYLRVGAFGNGLAAVRGLAAGLLGRTGRPDHILRTHCMTAPAGAPADPPAGPPAGAIPRRAGVGGIRRRFDVAISLGVFAATEAGRGLLHLLGGRPRRRLTVLYYHAVRHEHAASFARQMDQLARWARVVPAAWEGDGGDGADRGGDGAGRPASGRRPVAVTFDDGFDSVLDHALPVLAGRRFACTIFVPAGCLGRPPGWTTETDVDRGERVMTVDRLAVLSNDLVAVGSHGMTHPHLTAIPPEAARHELAQSRHALASLTGRDVALFAFPYGDHDPTCVALCRDCGYQRVFTIEPRPVVPGDGVFLRGRVAVDASDGRLEFFLKATGSYRWMPTAWAMKRRLRRLLGRARPARRAAVDGAGP